MMIGWSGGLCGGGATVTMIELWCKVIMDKKYEIISRKVNKAIGQQYYPTFLLII